MEKIKKDIERWIPEEFRNNIFGLNEKVRRADGTLTPFKWKFQKKAILLAGPPGVGKSQYFKDVLRPNGYVLLSDDALMYTGNCASFLETIKDKTEIETNEESNEKICVDMVGSFVGDVLEELVLRHGANIVIENNHFSIGYIEKFKELRYDVELVLFYSNIEQGYDSVIKRSQQKLGELETRIAVPGIFRDVKEDDNVYIRMFIKRLSGNISFLYANRDFFEDTNISYKIVQRLKNNSLVTSPDSDVHGLIRLTLYIFELISRYKNIDDGLLDDKMRTVYNFFTDFYKVKDEY